MRHITTPTEAHVHVVFDSKVAIAERGGFAGRETTPEQEAEILAVVDEVRKNYGRSKPEQ
jgi:hypothetical protein